MTRDTPATAAPRGTVAVWDPLQRVLHGVLVLGVALAWWAGEERLWLHLAAGYAVLASVCLRGVWGVVGSRHARFARFVQGPRAVLRHARQLLEGRAHRFLGHNPLGAWMVVALLGCLVVVCVSGVLYTTDRFWGLAWIEQTHRLSAWALVVLVGLHLAGVLFMSWRHRENLIGAMWSGRKRAPRAE